MSGASERGERGLVLDRLSHGFVHRKAGRREILTDVRLEARPGEFLCVMGPSGCGKSTLLNIAAGFVAPDAGTATWQGRPIRAPGRDRGMVFQKPELYPWLDVWGNVMFGPKATGRGREAGARARELLAEVGLAGFEHYRPYELSGGMQHRVALARTLVNDPELLLMDEPFAALDAQTRQEMQALLLDVWQRHRRTVVFVTHDAEEALLLADRVAILSGRPSTVTDLIDVGFARPRGPELVFADAFVEMRRRIRDLMKTSDEENHG
ncbi:MAG TPA: ABC transporter ATP-binding protein [Streptosporangiales bacterium]